MVEPERKNGWLVRFRSAGACLLLVYGYLFETPLFRVPEATYSALQV